MSKRYSIVIVMIVISVIDITTTSSVMIHENQHTAFAQLPGQESLDSNAERASIDEFSVPLGSRPHDVAPMPNGTLVWYTAQGSGELGKLDPTTGKTHHIALDKGSAPHGVIIGPDGAPWITDGGLNAIVRVDPLTEEVRVYPPTIGRYWDMKFNQPSEHIVPLLFSHVVTIPNLENNNYVTLTNG